MSETAAAAKLPIYNEPLVSSRLNYCEIFLSLLKGFTWLRMRGCLFPSEVSSICFSFEVNVEFSLSDSRV